jgi:predicted acyl esterase
MAQGQQGSTPATGSGRRSIARACVAAVVLAAALLSPATAAADFPSVFGGDVTCAAQSGSGNVRLCSGPTTTWDGQTKIDVNVILPPAPGSGPDGPYPLIGDFHGWGGSKIGINPQTESWAKNGYAVFSMSDRGWGSSCGGSDPQKLLPACAKGYNHLMDDRIEVRDAQYLISVLADEGAAEPQKIGATGFSYGGGMSMALAALRDRTMLPDGSLEPWTSPEGKPMAIAAAVPQWPWTDLAYSLMPNGRNLDYVDDSTYTGPEGKYPIGIGKQSFQSLLYGTGLLLSNYAAPGTDPQADLTKWFTQINVGEPYEADPATREILDEIMTHHSSYYIDHSEEPAPLLIQSGWNDDLFPADEAIRYYNRTRTQYPGDPISLYFMDDGHMRSQNKEADAAAFVVREEAWFSHYLKGAGPAPTSTAEALTTKCGGASEGPYSAPSWDALSPGEIRFSGPAKQTITPGSGNPAVSSAFDPVASSGACATASGADQTGVATYRLPPAPESGYTLMGSPTVIADINAPGGESEIAARLLDVAPNGKESLVARALLRPGVGGKEFVFQLHPQGYRFEPEHIAKLELLPSDPPYGRTDNLQQTIEVENLELRLPVLEEPGAGGGIVQEPAPVVLPKGDQPSIDNQGASIPAGAAATSTQSGTKNPIALGKGKLRATKKRLLVKLRCPGPNACSGTLTVNVGKRKLASGAYEVPSGVTTTLRLPLTKAGRAYIKKTKAGGKKKLKAKLTFSDSALLTALILKRPVQL